MLENIFTDKGMAQKNGGIFWRNFSVTSSKGRFPMKLKK